MQQIVGEPQMNAQMQNMSMFKETIIQMISHYRRILKRFFEPKVRRVKLINLEIKKAPLYRNDIEIYVLADRIIKDIDNTPEFNDSGSEDSQYYHYSGPQKFKQHLKNILEQYRIIGNNVVHTSQIASEAMLKSIQSIQKPAPNEDQDYANLCKNLINYGQLILNFGSKEQYNLFSKALANTENIESSYLNQIMTSLDTYQVNMLEPKANAKEEQE